jgi:hypothetical protein
MQRSTQFDNPSCLPNKKSGSTNTHQWLFQQRQQVV